MICERCIIPAGRCDVVCERCIIPAGRCDIPDRKSQYQLGDVPRRMVAIYGWLLNVLLGGG